VSAETFARVLATFRGERFPLDEHGARCLRAALDPTATDLAVTSETFHIRPARGHDAEYPVDAAPSVLSFLLERAGTVGPRSIKTWIAPTTIRLAESTWAAPARHVLAEAWTSRVLVRIREHEVDLDDELPTVPARKSVR
jgi:hypothetical protein